eukprot:1157402-Pelagomonas_calceolata.AAC.2
MHQDNKKCMTKASWGQTKKHHLQGKKNLSFLGNGTPSYNHSRKGDIGSKFEPQTVAIPLNHGIK